MTTAQRALGSVAYSLFALHQPLALDELRAAAGAHQLPMAQSHSPGWFAAAASEDSSLMDMAPELQVLSVDLDSADQVDVSGIDLIHVYAPELQTLDELDEPIAEPEPEPVELQRVKRPETRTSTQLGLLKELDTLDN